MPRTPRPWFRKSDGCWYVVVRYKRVNLGPDEAKALAAYHRMMADLADAKPLVEAIRASRSPDAIVTILGVVGEFLEWSKKHHEHWTYVSYRLHLRSLLNAVPNDLPFDDLTPAMVNRWLDGCDTWSSSTKHGAVGSVRRLYTWAIRQGITDRSPVLQVDRPPKISRQLVLTTEQITKAMAEASPAFRELLTVLLRTGCRVQEARVLSAKHRTPDGRFLVMPALEQKTGKKTGQTRIVALDDDARELIDRLAKRRPKGTLLRNTKGRPWTKDAIKCTFARLRKKIPGLPKGICGTTFRHTYATNAIYSGVDLETLRVMMGHSDLSMLSRVYGHVAQNLDRLSTAAQGVSQRLPSQTSLEREASAADQKKKASPKKKTAKKPASKPRREKPGT